jgi:hypothetical protein
MNITVDIDIYDYLDEISDADLEAELAERRKKASRVPPSSADKIIEAIDHDCIDTALWHWRQGRTEDALHFLERALGREWNGLGDVMLLRSAA